MAAVWLAVPAAGNAAVTIGSDLGGETGTVGCDPNCTLMQFGLPGRQVRSPMNGVVVRWRVRNSGGNIVFRVLRSAGGTDVTGVSSSAPVNITSAAVAEQATRQPINAGDYIGIDLLDPSAALGYRSNPPGGFAVWLPKLGDGETRSSFGEDVDELLYNADVEPDADRDGFGDETQDLCSKDPSTQGLCKGPCSNAKNGTPGNDVISGTNAGDLISAGAGNDIVNASAGDDCVAGQNGNDKLSGGSGRDTLSGGNGKDKLTGGAGNDNLKGGAGKDTISGGPGKNRYSGGGGNDSINAANGKKEKVNCGTGTKDVARVDARDTTRGCERVIGGR